MSHIEGYRRTFTAGGSITKFDRVNLSAGNVVAADADDIGIGNALATVSSGEEVAVLLDNAPGTRTCVASGAIAVGDSVFQDASGQVTNDASDTFVGIALKAATAAGDEIEVLTGIGGEGQIKFLEEDFVIGDFTDNTDATGYVDMTGSIPAGGLVLGWQIVTTTGFTGDTTAVAQVGAAGNVNQFSALTNGSVLAAGTIGSQTQGATDNAFCAAATTPRLTVTGAADFTSISAGACTLKVAYVEL